MTFASVESDKINVTPVEQLFGRLHHQLALSYRDASGEYPASCVDLAVDLAHALIGSGGNPSFVRLSPDQGIARYLRPRVYGGVVEWTGHVAIMDDSGHILDPILPEPVTLEDYVGQEFLDGNVRVVGIISGEDAKRTTAAEMRCRQLEIF